MVNKELKAVVINIILSVANDANIKINEISDDENLLILLDSMDIVSLIMDTESEILLKYGINVSLANEFTFDIGKSPLTSFSKWLSFISDCTGIKNE
jgi:hypothetical protein